jgi:hypothetical protein
MILDTTLLSQQRVHTEWNGEEVECILQLHKNGVCT